MDYQNWLARTFGPPGTDVKIKCEIDPELGSAMLGTIARTHRWHQNNAARIGRSMDRHGFKSEESPDIVLGPDGRLESGRHRLSEQVDRRLTYIYWVRRCATAEQATACRELGDDWPVSDSLRYSEIREATAVASAATYVYRFLAGQVASRQAPPKDLALDIVAQCPEMQDWVGATRASKRGFRISHGMCIATAYLAQWAGADTRKVSEFWELLGALASPNKTQADQALASSLVERSVLRKFDKWVAKTQPSAGQAVRRSENVTWELLTTVWTCWITGRVNANKSLWDLQDELCRKAGSKFPPLAVDRRHFISAGSAECQEFLKTLAE